MTKGTFIQNVDAALGGAAKVLSNDNDNHNDTDNHNDDNHNNDNDDNNENDNNINTNNDILGSQGSKPPILRQRGCDNALRARRAVFCRLFALFEALRAHSSCSRLCCTNYCGAYR